MLKPLYSSFVLERLEWVRQFKRIYRKKMGDFFFTSVDVHFHANASDFERRCL